jgi:hypothetical protein
VAEAAAMAFGCRLRLIACCLFHNKDRARSQLSAAGVKTNFAATAGVSLCAKHTQPQSLPSILNAAKFYLSLDLLHFSFFSEN